MKSSYTEESLIQVLKGARLGLRTFSIETEGTYTVDDAIWNYRDALSHLPFLHSQVQNSPVLIEPTRTVSIFFQKLFFFRFPLTVVDQLTDRYTQTTFTNCFFFTLIVQNRCLPVGAARAKVITKYTLGIPKLLLWTFPILKFILKSNYKRLMSTDIPCRERRGVLRSWGYRFHSDNHGYVEAKNISANYVIPPEKENELLVEWPKALADGETKLVGRNDHRGVRVTRKGDQVFVFQRMCPHEGASLDEAPVCKDKELRCPWHGRTIRPLKILSYADFKQASLKDLMPIPVFH